MKRHQTAAPFRAFFRGNIPGCQMVLSGSRARQALLLQATGSRQEPGLTCNGRSASWLIGMRFGGRISRRLDRTKSDECRIQMDKTRGNRRQRRVMFGGAPGISGDFSRRRHCCNGFHREWAISHRDRSQHPISFYSAFCIISKSEVGLPLAQLYLSQSNDFYSTVILFQYPSMVASWKTVIRNQSFREVQSKLHI